MVTVSFIRRLSHDDWNSSISMHFKSALSLKIKINFRHFVYLGTSRFIYCFIHVTHQKTTLKGIVGNVDANQVHL